MMGGDAGSAYPDVVLDAGQPRGQRVSDPANSLMWNGSVDPRMIARHDLAAVRRQAGLVEMVPNV
jgi:hypothetical protein